MFSNVIKLMNVWVTRIVVAIFGAIVFFVFLQAILRYVFDYGLVWAEELASYLQIWLTFLGACLAFEKLSHVNIVFFINKLSPIIHLVVFLFVQFITLMFLTLLIYKGSFLIKFGWIMRTPALGIPMSFIYSAAPLCSIFMFLNVSNNIIEFLKHYRRMD